MRSLPLRVKALATIAVGAIVMLLAILFWPGLFTVICAIGNIKDYIIGMEIPGEGLKSVRQYWPKVKVRPLPAATNVWKDYKQWKQKNFNDDTVLLYELCLCEPGKQYNFKEQHYWAKTPIGKAFYTRIEFQWEDPIKGKYLLYLLKRGRIRNSDILRMGEKPVKLYVCPVGANCDSLPELEIIAIEKLNSN